jgi:hypothetical protein
MIMRAFVRCSRGLASFAAILSSRVLAETFAQPPEEPLARPPAQNEEIIVRGGKSLSEWRMELNQARNDLFKLFNESNEGEDNDIQCRNEAPTGSRIPQSVCRSRAEDRADANGARHLLNALTLSSGPGSGDAALGTAEAQSNAVLAGSSALAQYEEEWRRVLSGDRQFYEAVLKYAALEQQFDSLSGNATSASAQQPRQILLGRAGPQCEATTLTEFEQRNNVARVSGTVSISSCPAGTTGSFTLVAQVRDDAGAITPIEFNETWQRADAQDHIFESQYPIGEDVFLQSVRVRNLECTCADPRQ